MPYKKNLNAGTKSGKNKMSTNVGAAGFLANLDTSYYYDAFSVTLLGDEIPFPAEIAACVKSMDA